MNLRSFLALAVLAILSQSVMAAEGTSELSLKGFENPTSADVYKVRIVPQVGISSMQYSGTNGGNPGQTVSGGVTTEIGQSKARLLETGILLLQSDSNAKVGANGETVKLATKQIAIPLMGKIRFVETKSQSWYAKFGALTTFESSSNKADVTTPFDVLISGGIGARVPASKKVDFIAEATYNRGMFNAFRSGTGVHEGVMVFTGLSFGI